MVMSDFMVVDNAVILTGFLRQLVLIFIKDK